jgi:hypothetical protein
MQHQMSAPVIQDGPFTRACVGSEEKNGENEPVASIQVGSLGIFHKYYFHNHARRLRLKILLRLELSRSPNEHFNFKPILDPGSCLTSETVVTWPFQKRNG